MMDDDLQERLVAILSPHYRRMRPPAEMALLRGVSSVITAGGEVDPRALNTALPWEPRDFWVAGAIPTGANVAQELRVRQPSRLVYLEARAKTAPAGAPLNIDVMASGARLDNISITAGQNGATWPANTPIAGGALLTLNVITSGGAANVTVTAWMVPDIA